MSKIQNYQVVVIGAGIVGLAFAGLLNKMGLKVAIIEASAPNYSEVTQDARVSAINLAAEQLLTELDVWTNLRTVATRIEQMQIWDQQSGARFEFDSAELNLSHLGSIIANKTIARALWENLHQHSELDFYCPAELQSLTIETEVAILKLKDGTELKAALIVGCDGAHSWLRQQMHIDAQATAYHQEAIVAVIQCEESHRQIAWQNFLPTGPLALLPLSDPHQCAIVWSCETDYAEQLMQHSTEHFNQALSNASEFCLGKLSLLSKVQAIALTRRHVKHYVQPRVALLGDAAHTMHPLAGQGLNFGLMDARSLAELIKTAHSRAKDIGAYSLLRRYERARKAETELMLASVGCFKTLFGLRNSAVVQARGWGMQLLNKASCLKERMARYALWG